MATRVNQLYNKEVTSLLNEYVKVILTSGKTYEGKIVGMNLDTLDLCLSTVKSEEGEFPKVVISGRSVSEIILTKEPFTLLGLVPKLKEAFGDANIEILDNGKLITIFNRVKITVNGVEGVGPIADRASELFKEYLEEYKARTGEEI